MRNFVQVPARPRVNAQHLVGDVHRPVEALLEQFGHAVAAVQPGLGRRIEVRAQLGEGLQLAEGGQVQPQPAGHLLHRRNLGRPADAGNRDAHVHRRALAGEEEVGLEVNLPVGDRNHVRRDVRGDFAFEGLDDRQRGERAAAERVAQLGRPLQQAAVGVEDVAGIRLAPGGRRINSDNWR